MCDGPRNKPAGHRPGPRSEVESGGGETTSEKTRIISVDPHWTAGGTGEGTVKSGGRVVQGRESQGRTYEGERLHPGVRGVIPRSLNLPLSPAFATFHPVVLTWGSLDCHNNQDMPTSQHTGPGMGRILKFLGSLAQE